MPDEQDRRWRRSLEQLVRSAVSSSGPHAHSEYLTQAVADIRYALAGAVGGGLTQILADLRYAAIVHSHSYAATGHAHDDYPAPSDGTPATVAATGSAGNGAAYARWNHVHGQGTHTHPLEAHNHDAAYATAGHTHAAGAGVPYRQRCTANTAQSSNVTYSNPTGINGIAVTAGKVYRVQVVYRYTAAAATTGIRPSFTGPAMTDFEAVGVNTTAAAATEMLGSTVLGTDIPFTAAVAAGSRCVIDATCKPSANGTLRPQFRSEVNASAITVQAGSYWLVEEVLEG